MLTAYKLIDNCLALITSLTGSQWFEDAVWVDLINPTTEEINTIEMLSGLSLPNIQETEEIEASSHYEVYPAGFQINCLFLQKVEETFVNINVAFLCNDKCLISFCAHEISAIRLLQKQWQKSAGFKSDPVSIIIALLEKNLINLQTYQKTPIKLLKKLAIKYTEGSILI